MFSISFSQKSRRLSLRAFSSVVLLNSMNSPTARTWVSEKQCVFGFCNHVDADILAYDFHRFEIICGYWHHKNTVEIFIGSLHFRQIISYLLIFLRRKVCQENGFLYPCASFLHQIFRHQIPYSVVLYVVHHKKQHISYIGFEL